MLEPLPFSDDPSDTVDGLVRALAAACDAPAAPGPMMDLELRFGDLIAASLDAAGIEDALTRMEMCNVLAATLYDRIADLGHQALAEGKKTMSCSQASRIFSSSQSYPSGECPGHSIIPWACLD